MFCSVLRLSATHIVGGEITYQYSGKNAQGQDYYSVRLDLYIDCLNGNSQAIAQDATAFLGVFDGNTGAILSGYPVEIPRKGPEKIVKLNYNCIKTYPNACVDHYWYVTSMVLPPRTGGYIISFQRCCRNNSITNLTSPQSTGANYWTKIPDSRTLPDKKPNSSAVFKELPPNFLCTNYELKFNHSATDADGDSLVYDLFQPYNGADQSQPRPDNKGNGTLANPPFPNVVYTGIYDYQNPIDGSPALNIDPDIGLLTLTPTKPGQFVVGIRVREYRKGVLISETKRDYQFNVDLCVIDVVASYYAPKFICGYTYKFDNKSTGATRFHWDFGMPGNADTSNQMFPTVTFPGPGKYRVSLVAYKNNCLDSFAQWVTVVQPQIPKLPADSIICTGKSVTYSSNITGDAYLWSTGSTQNSITVNKAGVYWLQVTANTCAWRDTVKLSVDADKVTGTGDTFYCSESGFNRTISALGNMASYLWSTGETTKNIVVNNPGYYVIKAKTINGCPSSDTVAVLKFSAIVIGLADTIVCPNTPVLFNAMNMDAKKKWSSGDTTSVVTITAPGTYWVKVTRGLCVSYDTARVQYFENEFALGPDLRFCNKIDTVLSVTDSRLSQIVWNSEVNGRTYRLTQPGKVVVSIKNSHNCPEKDSLFVNLFPNPSLNLGKDTVVCLSQDPVLDAGPGMQAYRWQDGSNKQTMLADWPGIYWVEITDKEGCRSRDSIEIKKDPQLFSSIVYMPDAFTPDYNGLNDQYPQNKYENVGPYYNLRLYNRWGQKIADYESSGIDWDGNVNGEPAPEGVYVFVVTWKGCDDQAHTLRGTFHLLR